MRKERVEDVRQEARKYFGNVAPSHDWHHVKRVYKIAENLAEKEDADIDIVRLSVLLHDIGREREDNGNIDNHEIWGAEKAVEILEDLSLDQSIIDQVKHCVESHRFSTKPEPETVEARVVSDADNIDALGATGIARTFCYAGESDEPLVDLELPPEEDQTKKGKTCFNYLEKKVLNLKDRIYTESGGKIADERHEFVKEYKQRFKSELKIHQ